MLYSCLEGRTGGYAVASAQEKSLQVVRYVRVSMEDQARDGVSRRAQQVKLEAYCLMKDWLLNRLI